MSPCPFPRTVAITLRAPPNASDETNIITFYNELSSLVRNIPKHDVLSIDGDMNVQIGKDESFIYTIRQRETGNVKQTFHSKTG